jgi:DNA replication protein
LYRKQGSPKFVTLDELLGDRLLIEGLGETADHGEALSAALQAAVDHGALLHFVMDGTEEIRDAFVVNNPAGKAALEKLRSQFGSRQISVSHQPLVRKGSPNVFALYEKNIGLLTPMIAEELKEAERLYPVSWIEEAFKEATSLNKRSWRYIARILERWSIEGKDSGEPGRGTKKPRDPDRYVKGKYGHLVRR